MTRTSAAGMDGRPALDPCGEAFAEIVGRRHRGASYVETAGRAAFSLTKAALDARRSLRR